MECWCPLSQDSCREDCAWADVEYEISDDGVSNETFCAIAILAGKCLADGANPSDIFI